MTDLRQNFEDDIPGQAFVKLGLRELLVNARRLPGDAYKILGWKLSLLERGILSGQAQKFHSGLFSLGFPLNLPKSCDNVSNTAAGLYNGHTLSTEPFPLSLCPLR